MPTDLRGETAAPARGVSRAGDDPQGNPLALPINSVVGGTSIAEFLATMRERHGGRTFTLADFIAGLAEVDPALASTIEHCMREDSLPGFLLSDARVFRLPDDENGTPRYQAAIHVRNDEPCRVLPDSACGPRRVRGSGASRGGASS